MCAIGDALSVLVVRDLPTGKEVSHLSGWPLNAHHQLVDFDMTELAASALVEMAVVRRSRAGPDGLKNRSAAASGKDHVVAHCSVHWWG